jgi:hypothetical protein
MMIDQENHTQKLIMYRSNDHLFEDVVEMIWIATGHEKTQCEQLAHLIELKGHTVIKTGHIDELIPMSETIKLDGFKTIIE